MIDESNESWGFSDTDYGCHSTEANLTTETDLKRNESLNLNLD